MKRIVLCADDYGQSPEISQAILGLIKRQKLSATSCMVTNFDWPLHASWLTDYKNKVDIGLHFNLTHGEKCSSLTKIILKSHLCILNKTAIRDALNSQLDSFFNAMHMLPDFIDGHQHVHQFPIIRDVLFEVYESKLRNHHCYLRSIYSPDVWFDVNDKAFIKKIILQLLGARSFKRELIKRGIPHNSSFAGIYTFKDVDNYSPFFVSFVKKIQDRGILMCHPGLEDKKYQDSIGKSRYREYVFFASDDFNPLLEKLGVKISRFKDFSNQNS